MSRKMHLDTSPKFISFSLKTLSAAVVSAVLLSSNAYAAGLGKLTVLSSLGQPLHAEIELTSVSKDEAGSLSVKLASTEAFRQANIEFNPALFALRFAVEQRGARQFIRVTSTQPINEPFVDMLLEVGGTNSRLVREYTFLLDPADLRRTQPAQVATPIAPANRNQAQQIARPESVPQPISNEKLIGSNKPADKREAEMQVGPRPDAKSSAASGGYQVKKGDTLAKIASSTKPEGISLDQMLVALQRANPDAFVGKNINRLRAGQILSVPNVETARSVSNSEAKSIVIAQATDFNSYQSKLAGRVAAATPQKSDEGKQSSTGKISAKVEEQSTAANESKDKLKLSKSGIAATGSDKATSNASDTENKIAKDKAIAEANARVKELEKNVSDLQKILEIKNQDLADKQKQIDVAKAKTNSASPAVVAAASPPAPVATAPSPASVPATPPVTAAVPTNSPATDSAPTPATPPVPVASAPAAESTPAATPLQSQPADVKAAANVDQPAAKPAIKPKATVPVVSPPETSFLDDLLDNPLLMSLLVILLVGLGGFGIYSTRRNKQRKDFQDSNILTDSSLKANSLFGSTGGQSVDTNNSVFNSNFSPSASQLDTNEVDPVAEADVYIAYGRDAQAEEILKEALRTQPERNAVRVKLLEIYANRKDLRAFEIMASELYSITKGDGDEWQQAASLGIALDPNNPLYVGGKSSAAVDSTKIATLTAPTQPLEELDLDALLNTTQGSHASMENLNTIESNPSYFDNSVRVTDVALPVPLPTLSNKDTKPSAAAIHTPAAAPVMSTPAPESSLSTGLDFDFDLAGLGLQPVVLPPAAQPEIELKPASNGLDFDFHQEGHVETDALGDDAIVSSITSDNVVPLEVHAPIIPAVSEVEQESAAAPNALDFDLSGIDFDLNPTDQKSAVGQEEETSLSHDFTNDAHTNVAEMGTKLDLALAYQEIGDKEGARELLDEVMKGGTEEQIGKAKSMLQKIA